ncbi:MAG: aromatic amino acid lyase, partial [Burkholderiales bacterium]
MKLGATPLSLAALRRVAEDGIALELDPACLPDLRAGVAAVQRIVDAGAPAYGINTGFGKLAQTKIDDDDLAALQENLVLSHAAGVGPPLTDDAVRMVIALKVASLARGRSGARPETIEALLALYNSRRYPRIPAKGSVGASGDLAPLAHLAMALMPMRFAPK